MLKAAFETFSVPRSPEPISLKKGYLQAVEEATTAYTM